MKKTYVGFKELGYKRNQNEYTSKTPLLDEKGNLLCSGWARKNLFEYDRKRTRPQWRGKEWDYYQVSDGNFMLEMSMANISIGGYASATLIDLKNKKVLATAMDLWLLGKNSPKHILPPKGDVPNIVDYKNKNVVFFVDTRERERILHFEGIYKKRKIYGKSSLGDYGRLGEYYNRFTLPKEEWKTQFDTLFYDHKAKLYAYIGRGQAWG